MLNFVVAYGTSEGQTAKVADKVVEVLKARGHEAQPVDVSVLPEGFDLDAYDAVVVGSSIHVGGHGERIERFVRDHRETLVSKPTGFFQVSLSSAVDDEQKQAEAAGYVERFIAATDWHPDRIAMFGGALRYSKYGFLKRLMMKKIAEEATGDTDTSRDYEYTNWDEVENFAADFAGFVERRQGVAPPGAGAR